MLKTSKKPFSGLHTPRLEARQKALEEVFSLEAMHKAWKEFVRPGLRDQDVPDLFEYNDFHWSREAHFTALRQRLIEGRYDPSSSNVVRFEKKLGICRTLVIPTPDDSIVLQCLVETILPLARKRQPSKNAFFSRSHSSPAAEFQFERDYVWFKQWPIFTKRRLSFASAHQCVVTTDISTFFDNVHHSHLRNMLSSIGVSHEVILDILFTVLERVCWRPDYLPSSRIGLPQVNFDAPRLLAHVYLFEADNFLKGRTNNSFVRWVDDITFAVPSLNDGKRLLRDLDQLLQMRGVRLNSGKTQVLSAQGARSFFHQRDNDYLDRMKTRIDAAITAGKSIKQLESRLYSSFLRMTDRPSNGHKDKIIKRYIGLFGRMKSSLVVNYCCDQFMSSPGMRETIYVYFSLVGPTDRILNCLTGYLCSETALDDVSIVQTASTLTKFKIKPKTKWFKQLSKLATDLSKPPHVMRSEFFLVASLWLACKYGRQQQLRSILERNVDVWGPSEFLSRQVAASSAKFRSKVHQRWLRIRINQYAMPSAMSLLASIDTLRSYTKTLPSAVRLYMLNGKQYSTYTIQRFLVTAAVIFSPNLDAKLKQALKLELATYISDPHYLGVISSS